MRKAIIFCILSVLMFSCKDKTDLSPLEDEIENLKNNINELQSVVNLQAAYQAQKKIVSAVQPTELINYWLITFSDNTSIELPSTIVTSVVNDNATNEYTIILSDGQSLVFNHENIVYPTGIVMLTQSVSFMKNTEVSLDFRVNPSNAVFCYDITSPDCQIELDITGKLQTYSYVTQPTLMKITRIEKVEDGQYKAYIKDNGGYEPYKYATALVISTLNAEGDSVQLSSTTIPIERKNDTGLPVVVIHTNNNAEILDKETWISATMSIDGIGNFSDYDGSIFIRGRGNSTWSYPKKPYAIKLEKKDSILGMPKHKRWVLLANYMDRTLLRDHIAFCISNATDLAWTPRGQFVELMLNDTHLGNYYLCEQIKIDKNRVDITEMESSDTNDENVTGGYLLEMDSYYDEVNKFKTKFDSLPIMIKDPDEDVLQPEQFDYIHNYIDSIETILHSDDFAETRSYTTMIDENSFIDWWFVQELTGNHEPQHPKSCYFYKDRSDVLKAGPVWDFDWGTFSNNNIFHAKDAIWFKYLFKDPEFVSKVKSRWTTLKPMFEEIANTIEIEGNKLITSAEINDSLWPLSNKDNINGDEKMPYRTAVYNMKNNYSEHLKWLDANIRNLK